MAKTPLARNIFMRRKAKGWKSAIKFAEHAGVPYPTFRDIEGGISGGRMENIEKIARALDCSVSDLYIDEPKPAFDTMIARIVELLPAATEGDLRTILQVLQKDQASKAKEKREA
jgi:transcriptional regulator with XRE-family HTH domain